MLGLGVGLKLSPPKNIVVSKSWKQGDQGPRVIEEEAYKQHFSGELLETYLFIDTQTQ
jgi:hypothetical protein